MEKKTNLDNCHICERASNDHDEMDHQFKSRATVRAEYDERIKIEELAQTRTVNP